MFMIIFPNLDSLKEMVAGMDGKIMNLEDKQEFARRGVQYLCNKFEGNMISGKTQDRFKLAGKSFGGHISFGGTIALEKFLTFWIQWMLTTCQQTVFQKFLHPDQKLNREC